MEVRSRIATHRSDLRVPWNVVGDLDGLRDWTSVHRTLGAIHSGCAYRNRVRQRTL